MKRFNNTISFAIIAIVALTTATFAATSFAGEPSGHDAKVVASFLDHIAALDSIDASTKTKIKTSVDSLSDAPRDAVTEGLLVAYPDYSAAVESSDNDDVAKAVALLTPLADSDDKFLAADASFYLARTLMNAERFEEALPRLESLTRGLSDFTVHQGAAQYFTGVALAGTLQNKAAIQSFMEFLQFNPDAPERLRVSAWRQVQELQAIEDGKLTDVHHHMDYSRRRLELTETGEKTQVEQDKIVKMLAVLIKEQEKSECNSSCKNSDKKPESKPGDKKPEKKKPSQSESKKGGSSANPNGEVVKKTYDDSPASPWSRLRDRSRDPANNAIKEKLPARYRDIVEKYYEAANGDGEKDSQN